MWNLKRVINQTAVSKLLTKMQEAKIVGRWQEWFRTTQRRPRRAKRPWTPLDLVEVTANGDLRLNLPDDYTDSDRHTIAKCVAFAIGTIHANVLLRDSQDFAMCCVWMTAESAGLNGGELPILRRLDPNEFRFHELFHELQAKSEELSADGSTKRDDEQ